MGNLFIVSTPIGNLDDITIRALKTLFKVDYIACEDTRRTGLLLQELMSRFAHIIDGKNLVKPKLISYYDQNEFKRSPEILDLLTKNQDVALISDAGTPMVSDPGYELVRLAKSHGYNIISIPGVSAAITALTTSGLSLDHFFFLGYPPEKQGTREKFFLSIRESNNALNATYILYCAPHKLIKTLEDIQKTLGDIEIVIAHELTKIHESTWSGKVSDAITSQIKIKGEIVILFRLER